MSEIRSQATPARDELDEKIQRWLTSADKIASAGYSHQKVRLCESMGFDWHETIAALQKALPRTVNSAAELKALPLGSVITWLDDDEREAAVIDWEPGDGRHTASAYWMGLESMISYPATVLFTPGDAG